MIEGVTNWQKEKRKASQKLDLRKLKRNRSLSCSFLNFSKSGPGLHGGDALAAVGADGGGGSGKDLRVGAVAGEGGDAGLGAGGNQDVVVLQVVVLISVMEVYRAHRAGKDGQVILLTEKVEFGVHRAVFTDGVHVETDLLPGLVVAHRHGAGALGAGAGHGAAAGLAVAHRTGLAVLADTGPGLL